MCAPPLTCWIRSHLGSRNLSGMAKTAGSPFAATRADDAQFHVSQTVAIQSLVCGTHGHASCPHPVAVMKVAMVIAITSHRVDLIAPSCLRPLKGPCQAALSQVQGCSCGLSLSLSFSCS